MNSFTYINNEQIERMLNISKLGKVGQEIFKNLDTKDICSPKKFSLVMPGTTNEHMNWINSMPAYILSEKIAGIKWVSVCTENSAKNLPIINGVIVLNNIETGIPVAILDAANITHYRTATSILTAAKHFIKNPQVVTIIGPGLEARYAALFLHHEFNIKKFNIIYRSEKSLNAFKDFMTQHLHDEVEISAKGDLLDFVDESDIVICASTSMQPVLNEEVLSKAKPKERFICGISAFNDISPDVLNFMDNVILDDGNNSIKRIEEVSKINLNEIGFKNILKVQHYKKIHKESAMNLFLPTGFAALDIGIANYFYKQARAMKTKEIYQSKNYKARSQQLYIQ